MKAFFERYSYDSVRMFLNQIVISMFGFGLAIAAVTADNDTLLLVTGIGAIIFYIMLTYGSAWQCGSRDRQSIELGKLTFAPFRGVLVSLVANSINLLLAILMCIGRFSGLHALNDIPRFIALFIQGMYQGVLAYFKPFGVPLNERWWIYLLLPLPAIITSLIGYIAGAKDFHITRVGVPELPASDRPTKAEIKEKRKEEREDQSEKPQ